MEISSRLYLTAIVLTRLNEDRQRNISWALAVIVNMLMFTGDWCGDYAAKLYSVVCRLCSFIYLLLVAQKCCMSSSWLCIVGLVSFTKKMALGFLLFFLTWFTAIIEHRIAKKCDITNVFITYWFCNTYLFSHKHRNETKKKSETIINAIWQGFIKTSEKSQNQYSTHYFTIPIIRRHSCCLVQYFIHKLAAIQYKLLTIRSHWLLTQNCRPSSILLFRTSENYLYLCTAKNLLC